MKACLLTENSRQGRFCQSTTRQRPSHGGGHTCGERTGAHEKGHKKEASSERIERKKRYSAGHLLSQLTLLLRHSEHARAPRSQFVPSRRAAGQRGKFRWRCPRGRCWPPCCCRRSCSPPPRPPTARTTLPISSWHWSTATVLRARPLLFLIIKVWDALLCSTSKHIKVNAVMCMTRSLRSPVSLKHSPQPVVSKWQHFPRLPGGLWGASPSTHLHLRPLTYWLTMRRTFRCCTARTTRRSEQPLAAPMVVVRTSGASCSAAGSLLPASRWTAKFPRPPCTQDASVATTTTAVDRRRMAPLRPTLVHRGWWQPFFLL